VEFTVKLANEQEITCIGYKKYQEYVQGIQRDIVELWVDADGTTFNDVDGLFTADNTARMENSADTGDMVYENYSIRAGIARVPQDSGEGERYEIKLAQLTYAEVQLQELQSSDLDNKEAIASLYETLLLGGGM